MVLPKKQVVSKSAEKKIKSVPHYVVYAAINNTEEDLSFILTALYHWEQKHPNFKLPKDYEEW